MTAGYPRVILAVAGLLTGDSLLQAQSPPPSPPPALAITTTSPLLTGATGTAYNQEIVTAGGSCPVTGVPSSTIDAGALPPGLLITSPPSTKQWFLQGIPTVPGAYSFTVHLKWFHNHPLPVDTFCTDEATKDFTLTVQGSSNPNATLAADRQQITATYHIGSSPPAADIVHVTSTPGATAITTQAVTDTGGSWLSVTPPSASTPATLTIAYSVGALTPGTYTGHITASIPGTAVSITIPVTLQVISGTSQLAVDHTTLSVNYRIPHFPPGADTVRLTSAVGPLAVTTQSVTDTGGPWLSVTPQGATTPAVLTIGYSVSGLAQGTYTGRVIVAITGTAETLTIPVTLTVSTDTTFALQSAPTSLVFTSVLGGADPPSQPVKITVSGDSVIFQAAVSAPPNGKWLTVTPTASATPATLAVAVTAKDLPVGQYKGTLTMAAPGISSGSVAIPVTFNVQAPAQKPVITPGGVVDAAGGGPAVAPGTWVSIFGTGLSTTTRPWRDTDFQNGRLPTSLDGVSVTINGKFAAVAFVSPGQVNVLAADDTATGLVPVVVKSALAATDPALVLQQTAAPALFQFQGTKYAIGVHVDGSLIAGPALVQAGFAGTAAHVGETIVLFGTGFGATQPPISATSPVAVPLPLAHPEEFSLRIGGVDAVISYAGLISPGLYQFNVVVPKVAAGDQPIVAELRGLLSQPGILLTIQP